MPIVEKGSLFVNYTLLRLVTEFSCENPRVHGTLALSTHILHGYPLPWGRPKMTALPHQVQESDYGPVCNVQRLGLADNAIHAVRVGVPDQVLRLSLFE